MADSISRITAMIESARELALEAAAAASAKLAETPTDLRPKEVSNLLNSRTEREILKGLKYVISLISSGEDASQFFTDVVKNVTSSNLKIRKLVYTYLLRYADKENDTALLSINAIQKSLGDTNCQVRALALRVMSEIKIPSIYPIVMLGIKKCSTDPSPSVRKAAAISLVKVYNNYGDPSHDEVVKFIKALFSDRDTNVLNSAILAYKAICPENYELIHGHFRRFCRLIDDLDQWSQTYLVEILTNYARKFLPKPRLINQASNNNEYIELPDNYNEITFPVYDTEYDVDLRLFLDSIKKLIYSSNEAVVLAVGRAYFHLTPPKEFKESQIAAAFVRILLTSTRESQNFILQSVLYMAVHDPTLFVKYEKRFYLLPSDDFNNAQFKLKILSVICNETNIKSIIHELQYYALNSGNVHISIESVKAIGVCSQIGSYWSSKTLKWLLHEISKSSSIDNLVISEFLTVIRYLIQQNPEANVKTVIRLAKLLDGESLIDGAKESVIWLVGEFSGIEPRIGPNVLRKLLKGFAYEKQSVRYQIILLASKIYSYNIEHYKETTDDQGLNNYDFNGIIPRMFNYAIQLGRYDDVYDIRDRSRMLYSLLSSKQTQLATLILQAPKPVPLVSLKKSDPVTSDNSKDDYLATLPIDELIRQYNDLPQWANQESLPAKSIRDVIEIQEVIKGFSQQSISSQQVSHSNQFGNGHTRAFVSPSKEKRYRLQSLDDFFAEEDDRPPPKASTKKTIIYEEESESEEDSSEEEDSDEETSADEEEEEEEEELQEEADQEDEGDHDEEIQV